MAMAEARERVTFVCPICGADVPSGAPGCRECGSTQETGWSADTEYDGLDLPDREDDEEEAVESRRYPLWVIVTAAVVAVASIVLAIW